MSGAASMILMHVRRFKAAGFGAAAGVSMVGYVWSAIEAADNRRVLAMNSVDHLEASER